MAFLIRSAAEPCTTVLIAWRSASILTGALGERRSGRRRKRPRMVRTAPVSRPRATVSCVKRRSEG
jgi:hypothetical protein